MAIERTVETDVYCDVCGEWIMGWKSNDTGVSRAWAAEYTRRRGGTVGKKIVCKKCRIKERIRTCSLQRLFDEEGATADIIWKYVDDVQLHVWEMRHLPREIRELFQSDMRIIVDYLAEGDGYRSDRKVIHKEATVKMLRVLSGDTNVDDTGDALKEMGIKEEDEIRVCELFDQYTRKGIAQGISQGISQGVAQGIIIMCKDFNTSYEETLQKVRLKLNISEQEAEKEMKLYW